MRTQVATVLERNLKSVRHRIERACERSGRRLEDVVLVAVTKSVSAEIAQGLVELGQVDLAENRPQVLWAKAALLGPEVHWHLIGHLQTNKIRRTLPLVSLCHSLDRLALAEALDTELSKAGARAQVLLEINITGEPSKQGWSPDVIRSNFDKLIGVKSLDIKGLMTMARLTDDAEECRPTFRALRELRDELQRTHGGCSLPFLSMGMSGDFEVAVEEGATHVRIGSALFEGARP